MITTDGFEQIGDWPRRPDANAMIAFLERYGFLQLSGGPDGCICSDFSLFGIEIIVNCHKSGYGSPAGFRGIQIRVLIRSGDARADDFRRIADVLINQVRKETGAAPVFVSFKPTEHSDKCAYCLETTDELTYLCGKCLDNPLAQGLASLNSFFVSGGGVRFADLANEVCA